MNQYQKSIALDLLGRKRDGIKAIINALGDEFFNKHAEIKYEYSLISQNPKQIYSLLYGEDQYTNMVTCAELRELEESFLQVHFTIKYTDKFNNVWGNVNRTFTVNKKNIEQYPKVFTVKEKIILMDV